jgi:hypothetical protein
LLPQALATVGAANTEARSGALTRNRDGGERSESAAVLRGVKSCIIGVPLLCQRKELTA